MDTKDVCMIPLVDNSSLVSMPLDVTRAKHVNCDLDDVCTFISSLSSYKPLEKGSLFNCVYKARVEGLLALMKGAGLPALKRPPGPITVGYYKPVTPDRPTAL